MSFLGLIIFWGCTASATSLPTTTITFAHPRASDQATQQQQQQQQQVGTPAPASPILSFSLCNPLFRSSYAKDAIPGKREATNRLKLILWPPSTRHEMGYLFKMAF
uniref:Putative secreted protein n=1 Tax=Anopheles darlingi TaxID=43151 RepID=A0A2M4DIH2_ANODA